MVNPIECAARIILNDPSLAEPLFDLLLWANQPNLAQNNIYDELLEMTYMKLQHCRDARDIYAKGRAA